MGFKNKAKRPSINSFSIELFYSFLGQEQNVYIFMVLHDTGEETSLHIRKENARKGSESKENSNLRRLSMAGYFLKKWEGEQKMPALSAEIGQKKVGFVTEPNFQLKCFSFTL